MLIRISLIIALVAALAAGGLAFFKVQKQAEEVVAARDDYHQKADSERDQKTKAQAELKKTKADLEHTSATLKTTQDDLASAKQKADSEEKRATELDSRLTKVTGERDEAQQKLAAYAVIGLEPDQIKGKLEDLKKTEKQRDAFIAENHILNRKKNELQAKLDALIGDSDDVKLPEGLKGKIVAVDPRYDFVVLNIGGNQGCIERGKLLVNRSGKLIGKLQIVSVEPERCIANVMPNYRNGDVMEGDEVFY